MSFLSFPFNYCFAFFYSTFLHFNILILLIFFRLKIPLIFYMFLSVFYHYITPLFLPTPSYRSRLPVSSTFLKLSFYFLLYFPAIIFPPTTHNLLSTPFSVLDVFSKLDLKDLKGCVSVNPVIGSINLLSLRCCCNCCLLFYVASNLLLLLLLFSPVTEHKHNDDAPNDHHHYDKHNNDVVVAIIVVVIIVVAIVVNDFLLAFYVFFLSIICAFLSPAPA